MSNERQQRAARAEQMRKEREKADKKQRNLITVAIVAVVVVLIGAGGYAIKSASDANSLSSKLVAPANVDKAYGFDYTAADAAKVTGTAAPAAPATDPVVIDLTEDFQCPVCEQFEQQSGAFLDDLVAKGEVVLHYQPISFLDRSSANEYSTRSLNAALCVLDKGGVTAFKKMHTILYANQPEEGTKGPEDPELIADAKSAGVTGVSTCINKQTFGPWIKKGNSYLQTKGFQGTPWVRIAGKDVASPTPETMQAAIDAAKKA